MTVLPLSSVKAALWRLFAPLVLEQFFHLAAKSFRLSNVYQDVELSQMPFVWSMAARKGAVNRSGFGGGFPV